MNLSTSLRPKMRLRAISLAVLFGWATGAYAVGLGPIAVQSGLTQRLDATVPVYGLGAADAASACVKSRLQNLDGSFLARGTARIVGSGQNGVIEISTAEAVNEPALRVEVQVGCSTAVKRIFDVMLDPVSNVAAAVVAAPRVMRAKTPDPVFSLPLPREAEPIVLPPVRMPPASVLKVGGPESIVDRLKGADLIKPDWDLKPDSVLSLSRPEASESQMAMWRTEQSRLAAVLRGEDPMDDLAERARVAERQTEVVKKSAFQAKAQAATEKAALQNEVDRMFDPMWVYGLGGIALTFLAGAGALAFKRRPRRQPEPWHKGIEPSLTEAPAVVGQAGPQAVIAATEPAQAEQEPRTEGSTDAATIHKAANLDAEMAQFAADVAGILCNAEHWMAEQDPQAAIQALEPYCDGPALSPAPALYLLELFRALENEAAYAEVREHVKQTFAVAAPEWTVDWMQQARTIETFPAIRQAINDLAGGPELLPFLQGLLLVDDSRFDFNVYRNIVREIIDAVAPPALAASVPAVAVVEAVASQIDSDAGTPAQALVAPEPVIPAQEPVTAAPQPIVPMEGAPMLEADFFANAAAHAHGDLFASPEASPVDKAVPSNDTLPPMEGVAPAAPAQSEEIRFELPDLDFPRFPAATSPQVH